MWGLPCRVPVRREMVVCSFPFDLIRMDLEDRAYYPGGRGVSYVMSEGSEIRIPNMVSCIFCCHVSSPVQRGTEAAEVGTNRGVLGLEAGP